MRSVPILVCCRGVEGGGDLPPVSARRRGGGGEVGSGDGVDFALEAVPACEGGGLERRCRILAAGGAGAPMGLSVINSVVHPKMMHAVKIGIALESRASPLQST